MLAGAWCPKCTPHRRARRAGALNRGAASPRRHCERRHKQGHALSHPACCYSWSFCMPTPAVQPKHTGATRRVATCWLTCTIKHRPLLRCEVVLRVICINRLHHCARCTSWARHTGRATSRDNLFSLPRSPEQLVSPTTSSLKQRGQLLMARGSNVLGLATVRVQAAAGAAR